MTLLKLELSNLESKPEIHSAGRGSGPQQIVKSLLFAARPPSIAEVKVVANGCVRKVNVLDAESAAGYFRAHKVFVPLVRFWLRYIADRREVKLRWAMRRVLNNAEFSNRIDRGGIEFDLV